MGEREGYQYYRVIIWNAENEVIREATVRLYRGDEAGPTLINLAYTPQFRDLVICEGDAIQIELAEM